MNIRLYLAVAFWGEEYRRYFLDFCLPSLLAPGNIPAISDKASARLLIATNASDWAALQSEPIFAAARDLIPITQVQFDQTAYSDSHGKMLVMSQAHKRLANRMFQDRAQGVFLYPDMIAATGFISKLQELGEQGFSVVMFMNVRFANEGILSELREKGLARPGAPIAISPRELAKLTISNMHSELRRSDFEGTCDDFGSSSYYWVVTPGEDLLFHCGSWIPLLIDYGSMNEHDDTVFESWTLDGDYIAKNITDSKRVHFVRDTSDLFMISFTPESSVHYSLSPILAHRIPQLRERWKIAAARAFLFKLAPMDWLIKEQFRRPVRLRGGVSSETQWRVAEGRAAKIIKRMEASHSVLDAIFSAWCLWKVLVSSRKAIIRRLGQMLRGDAFAWRRAGWRVRQVTIRLFGRKGA
jgi:hypothetical protein